MLGAIPAYQVDSVVSDGVRILPSAGVHETDLFAGSVQDEPI